MRLCYGFAFINTGDVRDLIFRGGKKRLGFVYFNFTIKDGLAV